MIVIVIVIVIVCVSENGCHALLYQRGVLCIKCNNVAHAQFTDQEEHICKKES
jgi:hypothetical protein